MGDAVVRYIPGNFTSPNVDNTRKVNPNYDVDAGQLNIQNQAMQTFLLQQIKGGTSAAVARIGRLTGNKSLARNLSFLSNVKGDVLTLAAGFGSGGPVGLGIAATAVVVEKGLQAFDISTDRRIATIESDEQARRSGFIAISKGREYR